MVTSRISPDFSPVGRTTSRTSFLFHFFTIAVDHETFSKVDQFSILVGASIPRDARRAIPQEPHYSYIWVPSKGSFMYKFPLNPSGRCPHCGRKLGLTRRLEQCAFSGEVVCSKCIVGGRFSEKVWASIPREYQQKFRIFDALLFIAIMATGLILMGIAVSTNAGWDLGDAMEALVQLLLMLAPLVVGIILLFSSFRIPLLGSWLFYKWIENPAHKKEVEDGVAALAAGTYTPKSKPFTTRERAIAYLKRTRFGILHVVGIACNVAALPLYFIIRTSMAMSGTFLSMIAGVIIIVAMVSTFLSIIVASGYYCNKSAENQKQKKTIEILSWLYVIVMPLAFFLFPLALIAKTGYIDEIPGSVSAPFLFTSIAASLAQPVLGFLLNYLVYLKAKPDFERSGYGFPGKGRKVTVKQFFSDFALFIFILVLVGVLFLALVLLVADFMYALAMLSSTAMLFGIAIPFVFMVLKLARRRPHRYNQPYWTFVKISIIVISINAVPALLTDTWTRSSMDAQFAESFGPDWQAKVPAGRAALMNEVPFSYFDALYGFDIPINVMFTLFYGTDSPRYVRYNHPNGTTEYTDGSYKVTSIVDTFVFDAYLPQGVDFGDNSSLELPVIVWFHGIGMNFGIGNMNYTSQYLANQGYLVCDLEYGFVKWRGNGSGIPETSRSGRSGYDFPDTVQHIGMFTKFLEANSTYFHADMDNVYFGGRSFGAWMATVCAYGYNMSWMGTNFSATMTARGCLPLYGAHGIPGAGDSNMFFGADLPYIRGSSDSDDADYNPEWTWYDPIWLADKTKNGNANLCPTIMFHGTNDAYVVPGWSRQLHDMLRRSGYTSITGYYPLGAHGFDGMYWTQHAQNIHYYMERFIALTH